MKIDALCDGTYHSRIFEGNLTMHAVSSDHDMVKSDEFPLNFAWNDGMGPNYETEEVQICDAKGPAKDPSETKKLDVASDTPKDIWKEVLITWNPDLDPFHNSEAWQQPAVDREVALFLADFEE